MTRSERLGLEPGSTRYDHMEGLTSQVPGADRDESLHSIAISLKGLRVATERIADRLDDIASGTATLNIDVRQP